MTSSPITITDPDGRLVELTHERWRHIIRGHPEVAPYREQVLEAVRHPSRRVGGHRSNEEWFYLANAGPSRWLKVVVSSSGAGGRILTAFARRSMP